MVGRTNTLFVRLLVGAFDRLGACIGSLFYAQLLAASVIAINKYLDLNFKGCFFVRNNKRWAFAGETLLAIVKLWVQPSAVVCLKQGFIGIKQNRTD